MILKSDIIVGKLREGKKGGEKDPLVITPCTHDMKEFQESGSASIDLRLGTWFMTLRQARMSHLVIGPIDEPEAQAQLTKTHYVPFGDNYYLHPRSFVLSATLEWLRLPRNIAAYVIGKSSLGRRGLIIATATGVHPGFKGCLTLELSNVGELPIAIKPGMTICQLFLHQVDTATESVDKSSLIGFRRPTLGPVKLDPVARKLAEAYRKEPSGPACLLAPNP